MNFEILPEAIDELEVEVAQHEDFAPGAGARLRETAIYGLQRIRENPAQFPLYTTKRPKLRDVRKHVLPGDPRFAFIYAFDGETVRVLAFANGVRRPGYWVHRIG